MKLKLCKICLPTKKEAQIFELNLLGIFKPIGNKQGKFSKQDLYIIKILNEHNISQTKIGELYNCSKATIKRAVEDSRYTFLQDKIKVRNTKGWKNKKSDD